MPDLNDFYRFKSTTSDSYSGTGGCLPWALGFLAILWFIETCF